MAEEKDATCVVCSKAIKIGKFASLKTAVCEEHKDQKPKPAAKAQETTAAPAPVPGPAAPVAGEADPFAVAAAADHVTPEQKVPEKKEKSDNQFSVAKPVLDVFTAIHGKPLIKDVTKPGAAEAGFMLSPHGALYVRLDPKRTMSFVEMGGADKPKRLQGLCVTRNNISEGIFDQSKLYQLSTDEQAVLLRYGQVFLQP